MFRKEHQISTSFEGECYVREFANAYGLQYVKEYYARGVKFIMHLRTREWNALCDHLLDLQKCGIYPILL